jgi:hypothetical protein
MKEFYMPDSSSERIDEVTMNRAINDYIDAAEAAYRKTGSLVIDSLEAEEIGSKYGMDRHQITGARIVGMNIARSYFPELMPLDQFLEVIDA